MPYLILQVMKAVVYTRYGPPEMLRLAEVDRPSPGGDEVLVRVRAVSVNASDWESLRGKPLYARIGGPARPRFTTLGSDIAGRVEATGPGVTRFQPGDEVFGDNLAQMGGFAEYVCAREKALAAKLAGAEVTGVEVTGVDSTAKLDFVRSLGADHVVDYTREDFTRTGEHYDLVLDVAAHRSVFDYRRALAPRGRYLYVAGSVSTLLQVLIVGPLIGRKAGKKIRLLVVQPNAQDLIAVAELCQAGTIVPIIDRRFSLSEVPDALRYLGDGHAHGKLVITID